MRLAVFDFDGTSITGNSPVLLVLYLMEKGLLRKRVVSKILLWGFAYKLRLPQNEAWVRGLVFTAFCGRPKEEVDRFLWDFYDEVIESRFRPQADEAMRRHKAEGCDVLVISATFEPIVERAMEKHPFCHQISTRMRVDENGNYTCEVEGEPIEGHQKLVAITEYADNAYGKGNWELAYAYGDHHSDRPLLSAATHSFAVSPDNPLERAAKKGEWEIYQW